MNSCILMAEIIQEPQLRYTQDSQLEVVEMMVEFSGLRAEDSPGRLKVVGWGNLAREIQESYHQGDRVVLEGRLSMNTIERQPEGFKEKRAELTVSRIHSLAAAAEGASRPLVSPSTQVPLSQQPATVGATRPSNLPEPVATSVGYASPKANVATSTQSEDAYPEPVNANNDDDDIPF